MGLWSLFPSSALNAINDQGAYFYACYLSINIASYIPVGFACSIAVRNPYIRDWTRNLVKSRLLKAQKLQTRKFVDPIRKWRYRAREKRWGKLYNYSNDDNKLFYFGFVLGTPLLLISISININILGLVANESILMPVELLIAVPVTPIFHHFVQKFPAVDEKFCDLGDYCLESLRNELEKRKKRKEAKEAKKLKAATEEENIT